MSRESVLEPWVIHSELGDFTQVSVLVADLGCAWCKTVDTNDTNLILPEEQKDYHWHTAGYYHEDEDDTASYQAGT